MTIAADAACLGVEQSLGGRRWQLAAADERMAVALSQRLGLPEVVGRVLAARGVDLDDAESFLAPTLRDLLPDPIICGHGRGRRPAGGGRDGGRDRRRVRRL